MDLIFVSMENWDEIWRRNQFVCAELTKRFPQHKILFVGLARDVSNQIRRGKLRNLGSDDTYVVPGYPQITFTRTLKLLPNSIALCRNINDIMACRHVASLAKSLGLKQPVLWLNPHSAFHFIGKLDECAAVYDITDDWISLTQSAALKALTIQQDGLLCRSADSVIVCSQRLYEIKKSLAQNLHLIPNGVDSAHYASVRDAEMPVPQVCSNWEHPVLGYTGTIHPDRVDVRLVEAMANELTQGSIALVGPSHLSDDDRERLLATGRVHLTGSVPYSQIPDYMRAFDVCITPHLVTEFTESLNPIKLWEYLAAGKPIVSTPVAGFRDYPQHVLIESDSSQFLAAALKSLNEDPTAPALRQAEAQKHSWTSRVNTIVSVLEEAIEVKRGRA